MNKEGRLGRLGIGKIGKIGSGYILSQDFVVSSNTDFVLVGKMFFIVPVKVQSCFAGV